VNPQYVVAIDGRRFEPSRGCGDRSRVALIIQLPRPARKARYDLKPLLVHVRTKCNYLVIQKAGPAGCDRNRTHGAERSTGRRAARAARRPGPLLWGVAAPAVSAVHPLCPDVDSPAFPTRRLLCPRDQSVMRNLGLFTGFAVGIATVRRPLAPSIPLGATHSLSAVRTHGTIAGLAEPAGAGVALEDPLRQRPIGRGGCAFGHRRRRPYCHGCQTC
jgi:hypothetical protein